jgi:hypothetical protein
MDQPVTVKALFALGIVIALIAAFVPSAILPWVVGGTGILTGIVAWKLGIRVILPVIVLVVSLSAILMQFFNPKWLNDAVFFVRVFIAHVGLGNGVLAVFAPKAAE